MARVPEEEIERLKKAVSVERLAEARGVKLRKHGADRIGLCPFHDDREPSLVVTPAKNLWHCLGACQTGGSAIDWMMRAEGVSFRHAVELLRKDFPSLVAESSGASAARSKSAPKLPKVLTRDASDDELLVRVADYYHATMKESPEAQAYLASRGLTHPELVDTFRLGFSNRTLGYRLPNARLAEGDRMRTRLQALGVMRTTGHEHLSGSLVVPLLDADGTRVLGMYGRKITERLRAGTPLHLYLPGGHRGVWNEKRASFLKQAATELGVEESTLRTQMGTVLRELEAKVDEQMKKLLAPATPAAALMSEDERVAALALLRDPKLCDRILADFEACGVVGEETNKLLGYVAAVSRKLEEPLAIVIQSSSAAGKSSLMDGILDFVPEEERVEYSAMTGQALYYLGEKDLRHKVLAVAEGEGAERASYALKLLQSEGEISIASTGKDPETGKLVTHEYRVTGPVMTFLTTTAIEVDEELLNRCLVLTVDEGREQTRRVHARQRTGQTLAGLLARRDKERVVRVHRSAQRLLRPLLVVNPFAEELSFSDARTRARRDHMKYLTLIRAVAFLHQHQREVKVVEHGGERVEYIEATAADVAVATRLAQEILGRNLDELPPVTRRVLGELRTLVEARTAESGGRASEIRFTRREARQELGLSYEQLRVHLGRLVELEYVIAHRGSRGQSYVYELDVVGMDRSLGGSDGDVGVGYRAGTGPKPADAGLAEETRGAEKTEVNGRRHRPLAENAQAVMGANGASYARAAASS